MKSDFATLIAVASGGALGALARFGVGKASTALFGGAYPWATLAVNVCGCFAMGFLYFWLAGREGVVLKAFLLVGLLGAFTTFSAFALDAALLLRERTAAAALTYVCASVVLSLAGFALGAVLARTS
jgi:CrcB protein